MENTSDTGVVVRLYSPLGLYPSFAISDTDYWYANVDSHLISACRFDQTIFPEDASYSEFNWIKSQELRLMSSLALCVPPECGHTIIYPHSEEIILKDQPDLPLEEIVSQSQALDLVTQQLDIWKAQEPDNLTMLSTGTSGCYRFQGNASQELVQSLVTQIDISDPVLHRGLHALIKAQMLGVHRIFFEEAFLSLFIAMESTYQIIARRLDNTGKGNVSSEQIAEYVSDAFSQQPNQNGFFPEYYGDRIRMVHPSSRFGEFPYAPVIHCDYYYLLEDLISVFRFLITGIAK